MESSGNSPGLIDQPSQAFTSSSKPISRWSSGLAASEEAHGRLVEGPRGFGRGAVEAGCVGGGAGQDRLYLVDRVGDLLLGLAREHRESSGRDRRGSVGAGRRIDQLVAGGRLTVEVTD